MCAVADNEYIEGENKKEVRVIALRDGRHVADHLCKFPPWVRAHGADLSVVYGECALHERGTTFYEDTDIKFPFPQNFACTHFWAQKYNRSSSSFWLAILVLDRTAIAIFQHIAAQRILGYRLTLRVYDCPHQHGLWGAVPFRVGGHRLHANGRALECGINNEAEGVGLWM